MFEKVKYWISVVLGGPKKDRPFRTREELKRMTDQEVLDWLFKGSNEE